MRVLKVHRRMPVDEFLPFPPTRIQPNSARTLNRPMDKEIFKQKTEHLLKYHPKLERDVLVEQAKECLHCGAEVVGQRIFCEAYRLGTPNQYFKHTCKSCRFILYDGSKSKEYERHQRPTGPNKVEAKTNKLGAGRPRGPSKAVRSPAGVFNSLTEMSKFYNVAPCTMLYRLRNNPRDYYYI